jgi:hypothetical protein
MQPGTIRFDVIKLDDGDGLIHFGFSAGNGIFFAANEFYHNADFAAPFGQSLASFLARVGDTAQLEIGSMDDRSAYFLRLRAYTFDVFGHSALEVIVDNRRTDQFLARAAFQIHCEIAALNRLGKRLLNWSPDQRTPFLWKSSDSEA